MKERKVRLSAAAIAIFLFGVIFFIVNKVEIYQSDLAIILSFLVNILFFLLMFSSSVNRSSYSFQMIFWLFSLFFFGMGPLMQYLALDYSWALLPEEGEIFSNNLLILLWSVLFALGARISFRSPRPGKTLHITLYKRIFLAFICLLILAYQLINVGFINMMFRSTNVDSSVSSSSLGLVLRNGLRNILLFSAALSLRSIHERKSIDIFDIIICLSFLIGCFPTGLPRYMFAALYGGLLTVIFPSADKKRWYTFALVIGLVLVFPVLSLFRYAWTFKTSGDLGSLLSRQIITAYLTGDYDSHQMFISIRRYVSIFGITYGRQLAGVIGFFIPRRFWPSKPIGTGSMVIQALDQYSFTNVSAPLIGEAYINFGIFGLIIIPLLLGAACAALDNAYWSADRSGTSYIAFVYPYFLLYFFFILRGDLMSSWAYAFANLFIGFLMYVFALSKPR